MLDPHSLSELRDLILGLGSVIFATFTVIHGVQQRWERLKPRKPRKPRKPKGSQKTLTKWPPETG